MNASIVRWTKTHTLFAGILILAVIFGWVLFKTVMHSVAATIPPCQQYYTISVANGSQTTSVLTGQVGLQFSAPALVNNVAVKKVDFWSSNLGYLGRAQNASSLTSTSVWNLPLATQVMPNGPQIITANALLSDGSTCATPALTAQLYNPSPVVTLRPEVNPLTISSPANSVVNLNAALIVANNGFDAIRYADIKWATTLSTIEPLEVPGTARFFTGPTSGTGTIYVTMKYAGRQISKPIQLTVTGSGGATTPSQPGSTTTAPNTSGSQTTTVAPSTTTPNTALLTSPEQQAKLATTVQECSVGVLGVERSAAIKSGVSRPTAAELEKLKVCFAQTNNIVPSSYAPVSPSKVKELPKSNKTAITDLSNVRTANNKEGLKLSGKAKQNSTVILYVFSEPLVITTTTDENGDWTYTLEDPLKPGSHEVYGVVDSGDGKYEKTDPFSFVIGQATASAENPDGLSLRLENDPTPVQSNRNLYIYFALFGAIVAVGLVIIALLYRRWNKHNQLPPSFGANSSSGTSFTGL